MTELPADTTSNDVQIGEQPAATAESPRESITVPAGSSTALSTDPVNTVGEAARSGESDPSDAKDASDASDASDGEHDSVEDRLVHEGDIAADYLERLLDIIDFDGDIDLDVENDRALVAIVGDSGLEPLIGHHGATLDALQELTRLAVHQRTGARSRLMLDVGGFRQTRRTDLSALARRTAESVQDTGAATRLSPMNAFERKVVHDAIAEIDGVHSESEGEDPNRRVVVSAE